MLFGRRTAHKKERAGRTTARQTGGLRQVPPPRMRPQLKTDSRGGVATRVPMQYATDMPKDPVTGTLDARWLRVDEGSGFRHVYNADAGLVRPTAFALRQQPVTMGAHLAAARCNSYVRAQRRVKKIPCPTTDGGGCLVGYGACCTASGEARTCPRLGPTTPNCHVDPEG